MSGDAKQFAEQVLYGSHSGCLNLNRSDIREMLEKKKDDPSVSPYDSIHSLRLNGYSLARIEQAMLGLISEIEEKDFEIREMREVF